MSGSLTPRVSGNHSDMIPAANDVIPITIRGRVEFSFPFPNKTSFNQVEGVKILSTRFHCNIEYNLTTYLFI